jgi:DNA-directed RNA polymerase specialized sigma54-like protein
MAEVQITQRHALETLPQLTLRPSPALITATALLAVPSFELEQAVERELAENPALERVATGETVGVVGLVVSEPGDLASMNV